MSSISFNRETRKNSEFKKIVFPGKIAFYHPTFILWIQSREINTYVPNTSSWLSAIQDFFLPTILFHVSTITSHHQSHYFQIPLRLSYLFHNQTSRITPEIHQNTQTPSTSIRPVFISLPMSLYRFGHSAVPFTNQNGTNGVSLFSGHGKIAPDVQSATTQRIHAPLTTFLTDFEGPRGDYNFNLEQSHSSEKTPEQLQSSNLTQSAPTPQPTLNYQYQQPKQHIQRTKVFNKLLENATNQTDDAANLKITEKHQPVPREHAITHQLSAIQLPTLLYQHVATQFNNKKQHLNSQQQTPQSTPTSETQPALNITGFDAVNQDFCVMYGGRQSPTSILNDLWLFSLTLDLWIQVLPQPTVINGLSNINISPNPDDDSNPIISHFQMLLFSLPSTDSQPQQSSKYDHYICIDNDIYSVDLFPTHFETPKIQIITNVTSTFTMTPPSPLESSSQLTIIPTSSPILSVPTNSPQPLPRYKTASTVHQSILFIHGGRSGFAQNYIRKQTVENAQSILDFQNNVSKVENFDFDIQDVVGDDAFTIESILPLTQKVNLPADQSQSEPTTPSTPITPSPTSSPSTLPDPTYVSLILNDLWAINFNMFPYTWTRLDTFFATANQTLPSHRFAHAAQILELNQSGSESTTLHLVIHGGLRLNTVDSTYHINNKNTSSSYHKALIASPTLFFFSLSPFLPILAAPLSRRPQLISTLNTANLRTAHVVPTLLLSKPHHTDKSDQILLPEFIQTGQRPYDIYGHQLISVKHQSKVTFMAIGGTSHACLAGASIMALDIPLNYHPCDVDLEQSNDDEQQQNTKLYWTPIHDPIEDVLFIRHTATILNNSLLQLSNKQKTDIAILGGGALCFSFGSFYCPSVLISVIDHIQSGTVATEADQVDETQQQVEQFTTQHQSPYSQYTSLSASAKIFNLNHIPHISHSTAEAESQKNKKKGAKQQVPLRDNHTTMDVSKNIVGVPQVCVVCGLDFDSKNKLFKHISITGHKKGE